MGKRKSACPPGKPLHKQPIPTVVRSGNMIFSSAISGMDLATGEVPGDPEKQIGHAFHNMKAAVETVGGKVDDIVKVTVAIQDRKLRDIVNRYWLEMFPDENDRPVRHSISGPEGGGGLIQLEFVAVV
jgi:enamine deaminase RidA (YjgF/YER057c/UK114 family)